MANRSAAKTLFEAQLESGLAWLAWAEGATAFGAALKGKIPWSELGGPEKAAVNKYLGLVVPENQVLLNSLYLTMIAAFEEYLRATIKEIALDISANKPTYDNLSIEVRKLHIKESARLLRRVDSPPDYLVLNEVDLCRGLGSCVPGSALVELNAEALADVDGLLKLENFFERLNAFGVSLSFDKIGAKPPVKQALNMPKEGNRVTAKALEAEMVTMARYRNRIAHTGGNAADVTLGIARAHRDILKAVSQEIAASL